jgi:hypothetical protein
VILAIGGIVDAQLRFKPSWSEKRRRKLPDGLRDAIKVTSAGSEFGMGFQF